MLTTITTVMQLAAHSGVTPNTLIACVLVIWIISSDKRTKRVTKILGALAGLFARRK